MSTVEQHNEKVTRKEATDDAFIIAEFLDYLRQLAEADPDLSLTAGQVWELYKRGIRVGEMWWAIADDMNLPEPDWY